MNYFDNIRIVLVGTTHPGNIGAAARAMKTMGLEQLALVNPNRFPGAEATARASGASSVLSNALVVDNFDAALTGCSLIIGASARRRGVYCPELNPRACARRVIETCSTNQVAIVFGREHSGLDNEELDRCHLMVRIPTNPQFSSLNVAAAVQIIAYELRMAVQLDEDAVPEQPTPAPAQDMQQLYEHMQQVLLATKFLNPANPRHLMRRLKRFFNRAQPDQTEVNILRGILTSVQQYKRRS